MKRLILYIAVLFIFFNSNGQIVDPKNALKKKANKIIEKKVDEIPEDTKKEKTAEGKKEAGEEQNTSQANTSDTIKNLQVYSKYDFTPGEKIILYDDFSQDNIGDFPALWNTNGSGEVVTTNLFPGRWMKFSSRNAIWTDALLDLPENYTIEFDIIPIRGEEGGMAGYRFRLLQSINVKSYDHGSIPGRAGFTFGCEYFGRLGYRTYINSDEGNDLGLTGTKEGKEFYQSENHKYHIAIWVQKARVRMYQDENKVFDLPRAFPLTSVKMDRIRFEDGAAMVTNVRIAIGSPDMRSKLITEGKLVTYGIYFDSNKDEVKPESYGTLKEVATVL